MKKRFFVWFIILCVTGIVASREGYAQIDSRNQTRPDREQNASDPDKKNRKKKDKKKRVKSKKDPRTSGKKIYSNKKQIKRNSRGRAQKAKNVERSYKGDIAGRKQIKPRNNNREQRTYRQPDPYLNRRIRTEKSRAGPKAPAVRSSSKRGEKARTGDISGQKAVRQRSVRSASKSVYPQRNPYVGREIKTEKSRAKSNKKQIRSVRSSTKPSETRRPKTRSRPISATGSPRVKKKRNVYRSHERTGGEKSTRKDISGRKLRTKNTRSAVQTGGIEYSSINPYSKGKRYKEGERFRKTGSRYSSARSISRSSETSRRRSYDRKYGQHRNRTTIRVTGVVAAKSVRSTSDPNRKGEKPIYGKKYNSRGTRSVTQSGESKQLKRSKGAISVSGRRKSYRQKNTYRGKDKHFGENSSTKDIAGRRLRTRNHRSFHPTWSEFGTGSYGTGSVSGKPSKKYESAGGRRQTKAGWNNSGYPILGKSRGINSQTTSRYTGNRPLSSMPNFGPSRSSRYTGKKPLSSIPNFGPSRSSTYTGNKSLSSMPNYGPRSSGSYSGRIKSKNLSKYRGGNESRYAGGMKSFKPMKGGGSMTGFWNNKGQPLIGRGPGPSGSSGYTGSMPFSAMPSYGPSSAGSYSGRIKSKNLSKYRGGNESRYAGGMKSFKPTKGGGSITGFWNNKGQPLIGRGPGPSGSSGYTGGMPMSAMPSYGPSSAGSYSGKIKSKNLSKYRGGNESRYAGGIKSYKPLKGGGSITGLWNNKGKPIQKKPRNPVDLALSGYKGDLPMSALPSYGDGGEGVYSGMMKAKKPLKGGGGSITKRWNNNQQPIQGRGPGKFNVGAYTGTLPMSALPSYGDGKEGTYSGSIKGGKEPKKGGGSITTHWNNKGEPLPRHGWAQSDAQMGSYSGNVKQESVEIKQSMGTERGRSRTLSFLRIGDPTKAGLVHKEDHLKFKNDLPRELTRKERQRIQDADGLNRGRTQSLSFLVLGEPTKGGLHAEVSNKKRKNDLPSGVNGKNRLRIQDAQGIDHGKATTFSFWAIGDPTRGGRVINPAHAKGRLHPSSSYTKSGASRNSIEEKNQPIKVKIWWAKLFKKNANQPDAVKEKIRRPRYNKTERDIWEISERPDWYK